MIAIHDDHEIINDFDGSESDPVLQPAMQAFDDYMGSANPNPIELGVKYYEYRYGDAAFFVMDTRSYRSRDAVSAGASARVRN